MKIDIKDNALFKAFRYWYTQYKMYATLYGHSNQHITDLVCLSGTWICFTLHVHLMSSVFSIS